jgi:hypothetical protein
VIHMTSHTTNGAALRNMRMNHQDIGDQARHVPRSVFGELDLPPGSQFDGGFVDTGSGDLRFESQGSAPSF